MSGNDENAVTPRLEAERVTSSTVVLAGWRIDCGCKSRKPEWLLSREPLVVRRQNQQPAGRRNDGRRTAPGVTAALVGFLLACVIVRAAFSKLRWRRRLVGVRMQAADLMVRVVVRTRRRMIVILRGRAGMTRTGAAREGERNAECQSDQTVTRHGRAI